MGVGSGMMDGGDLGSRCQARGTRRMTGASISLEWTMTCVEAVEETYKTTRRLKRGQSMVKVSYSPPSPQGLQP